MTRDRRDLALGDPMLPYDGAPIDGAQAGGDSAIAGARYGMEDRPDAKLVRVALGRG